MQPELVGCDFGEKSGTRHTFIDWLIWLGSSGYMTGAVFAGVLEHDVLDVFEDRTNELNLVREIKAFSSPRVKGRLDDSVLFAKRPHTQSAFLPPRDLLTPKLCLLWISGSTIVL